jgi:hypothetical protein
MAMTACAAKFTPKRYLSVNGRTSGDTSRLRDQLIVASIGTATKSVPGFVDKLIIRGLCG